MNKQRVKDYLFIAVMAMAFILVSWDFGGLI